MFLIYNIYLDIIIYIYTYIYIFDIHIIYIDAFIFQFQTHRFLMVNQLVLLLFGRIIEQSLCALSISCLKTCGL